MSLVLRHHCAFMSRCKASCPYAWVPLDLDMMLCALTLVHPCTLVSSHPYALATGHETLCPHALTPKCEALHPYAQAWGFVPLCPCTLVPSCQSVMPCAHLQGLVHWHTHTLVLVPEQQAHALRPLHPCALAPCPRTQRATLWNFHHLIFTFKSTNWVIFLSQCKWQTKNLETTCSSWNR